MKFGKWKVWGQAGWFTGDVWKLICITIGETQNDWQDSKTDFVTILSLQFLYFHIGFGIRSYQ